VCSIYILPPSLPLSFCRSIFLGGYCSAVQGLLYRFEVDLGFPVLFLLKLICVLSVFLSPALSSLSPLVLFGRLALPPPAVGVPLESILNLVSLICPVCTCSLPPSLYLFVAQRDSAAPERQML